jgi:hypothetical protein
MPTDLVRAKFNAMITRQIAKANTLAEKIYWKGMYV